MTSVTLNDLNLGQSMMSATRSTKDREAESNEYKCPLLPKLKNTLRMMDDRT